MNELLDLLVKLLGMVGAAATLWFLFRKAPLERRASSVETEGKAFGLYTTATGELVERDERIDKLRQRLDEQEEEIKQLRSGSNAHERHIKRLERTVKQANTDTADYKDKWEATQKEAKQLAREIKILRVILRKNGWLTPEIEAEIAASLELPSGSTPPEGTPSVAPLPPKDAPAVIENKPDDKPADDAAA